MYILTYFDLINGVKQFVIRSKWSSECCNVSTLVHVYKLSTSIYIYHIVMKFTYTFTCRIFHANIMQIKPPITYSYLLMKSQHSISRRPHQNMYTYQITLLYCQILVYKDAFQHQSWCIQVARDTWKNACLTWQLVMQYSSHLQKSAETSWQLCVIVYPYVCS